MKRGRFQGVGSVVRFNWPLYLAAFVVLGIGVAVACISLPGPVRIAAATVALGSMWFLVGSLGACHWVYDRSDLYRWNWLRPLAPDVPFRLVVCHTGFDEVSASLRRAFPEAELVVLDHFDPGTMTEASIRRARKLHPPKHDDLSVPFDRWPPVSADLVLAPLSIHELRSHTERTGWFRQARSAIGVHGKVIVIEHARDFANFLAFGPGFVHFHSPATWRRSWEAAGLSLERSFRITSFVHVFVLT